MQQSNQTVAVVGGGVIGLSCAICLAQLNISVQLFARRPDADIDTVSYDARTYALSQASVDLLKAAGVTPLLSRYSDFEALEVWDANSSGRIHFDASDMGAQRLGIILEHKCLIDALWQRINQLGSIHCSDTQIISANVSKGGIVEAELQSGEQRQFSLVIGADGIHSRVRRLMGVKWFVKDYQQTAFAYIVQTAKDHKMTGWQRFSANGVLAFLPLADRVCAVVWSYPNSSALRIAELNNEDLIKITEQEIEGCLGELSLLSSVASVELRGGYVDRYVIPGMMLIGDAAHNIHPLAGQGANLGYADLAVLLRLLDERNGRLSYPLLRRYERTVKGYNQCMKVGLEYLLWLFFNQSPMWIYARTGGLHLVNRMPTLKNFFIRQAGGG
ncbi:MAG: FAD-dependent monooxygenase [Chromatiales bacterium]|nr:FAD-dependent monooxygenase [Chromatiales bacterium]